MEYLNRKGKLGAKLIQADGKDFSVYGWPDYSYSAGHFLAIAARSQKNRGGTFLGSCGKYFPFIHSAGQWEFSFLPGLQARLASVALQS